MSLRVDARFSGGNVAAVKIHENETSAEVLFAANPCGGGEALWFDFRILESAPESPHPESLTLTLGFVRNMTGCDSPGSLHPVYRGEGQSWNRAKAARQSTDPDGQICVSWTIPYPAPATEFALCYPYGVNEVKTLVQKSKGYWEMGAIGLSQEGRLVQRISNTTEHEEARPGLYLIARQHAGETPGSWLLDGMLQHFARTNESRVLVWAVPLADVWGIERGHYGRGANDLDQTWGTPPLRYETRAIQTDMAEWQKRCRPTLVLDLQAGGGSESQGIYCLLPAAEDAEGSARDAEKWANVLSEGLGDDFAAEDEQLSLANRLQQKRVAKECAQWIRDKTEIRSIKKPGFLHGKMYHADNNGVSEAILGSSNFTVSGLGLGTSGNNVELNLEVNDNRDRADLKNWFDEVWNDEALVQDVKGDVLNYLAQLYQNHSPEFVYYKTLFHIFEDYVSDAKRGGLLDEKTGFFESDVWDMLYDFQKDGVKGAINKILKHNGCIIADSVGLGKTFEALAVIKYFELLNGRVLVLCPKKLEDNWQVYRENDTRNPLLKDRFAFTVLAHTDLGRSVYDTHNWGNYDLVVIDESHNFRNNTSSKVQEDGSRKTTRYEFLMKQVLQTGVDTKVLLLSATPVNNSLKDLRNQLLLITQGEDAAFQDSLDIFSIAQVMRTAQTHFSHWADPKKNPTRKVSRLLDALDSSFFTLLDELTIARSRRHILSYYGTKDVGEFPKRLKPIALHPATDLKGYFPSYDDLHAAISEYKLSIFNPTAYLEEEFANRYVKDGDQLVLFNDQKKREFYLIGMMRTNYLKRLESSVHSFEVSIERTIEKIDDLLQKIDHFEGNLEDYTSPELFNDQGDEEEAELLERLSVGKKLPIRLEHLKRKEWKRDLKQDRAQLVSIHEKAAAVTPDRDAKLQELKQLIQAKVSNPINPNNRKVLIFTAFSDTAQYLYKHLKSWVTDELGLNVALVAGSGDNKTTFRSPNFKSQTDFVSILTNFSPRSKHREKMPNMPQEGEIDILIATDCISEGQNLQDCDYLINYDIHWNPVRIIQRFGRIDRIGSTNTQIQLVNFWPTDDLNKYINLKDRVEARMAMVDLAASGADNLLDPDQLKELVTEELTYREKQLIRLKDEVIDLEEMDDNVSLSEFTLDDFRVELMNFLANNHKLLEDAPLGLYAVTPTLDGMKGAELFDRNWHEIVKPGAIFCLRHKNPPKEKRSSNVNPLGRYYLLYIRDDGTVRFTFTQAKNALTMLQKLSVGKTVPYQTLCDLFDQETEGGAKMDKYSDLLAKAINAIVRTFQKRTAAGLQSGRDFVIPDRQEQATGSSDFELITWLVIRGERS